MSRPITRKEKEQVRLRGYDLEVNLVYDLCSELGIDYSHYVQRIRCAYRLDPWSKGFFKESPVGQVHCVVSNYWCRYNMHWAILDYHRDELPWDELMSAIKKHYDHQFFLRNGY